MANDPRTLCASCPEGKAGLTEGECAPCPEKHVPDAAGVGCVCRAGYYDALQGGVPQDGAAFFQIYCWKFGAAADPLENGATGENGVSMARLQALGRVAGDAAASAAQREEARCIPCPGCVVCPMLDGAWGGRLYLRPRRRPYAWLDAPAQRPCGGTLPPCRSRPRRS